MMIAREKIFGAVAAAIPLEDKADAVIEGNDTTYGACGHGLDSPHQPGA